MPRAPHGIGLISLIHMTSNTAISTAQDYETTAVPDVTCPSVPAVIVADDIASCQYLIEPLERSLESADTFEKAKAVRHRAEALRGYLRNIQAGLQDQNRVAAAKIRAERLMGEELARLKKAKGGQPYQTRSTGNTVSPVVDDNPPTLKELGVTKKQSSRWQAMAGVPEEDLARHVADVNDRGEELTSAGVMRLAKRRKDGPQRARNSTFTQPADQDDPATNGKDAAAVAGVVAITQGSHSIVGVPTKMQSLADAMLEPGGVANAGEETDTSETRGPPEELNNECDADQETALASPDEQEEALPVERSGHSRDELDSPGVRAELQLIGPFALAVSKLPFLPNRELIFECVRNLFVALAPACFENPTPKKVRGKILRPLRHCGFHDTAMRLQQNWAEGDACDTRADPTQPDMFPHKSASGD